MSAEVLDCKYLWQPPAVRGRMSMFSGMLPAQSPFIQNYIHDAESVWWLLLYFLLSTHPISQPRLSEPQVERRKALHLTAFPCEYNTRANAAFNAFHEPEGLFYNINSDKIFSTEFTDFLFFVYSEFREMLVEIYSKCEADSRQFNPEHMADVHKRVGLLLNSMKATADAIGPIEFNEELGFARRTPLVT